VYGFIFNGYWRDVGTIHAYWCANMDMLNPESGLNIKGWRVKTNLSAKGEVGDRPSAYIGYGARISNSLISRGCVIEGELRNSILSPGVIVGEHASVVDSVIFHDSSIGVHSSVQSAIIDKKVTIKDRVHIGVGEPIPNHDHPHQLSTGISIIGKLATIAAGVTIGKNCVVNPDAHLSKTKHKIVPSGSTV
jgi:glucose-1-phosphate adenylyltransferase